MRETAFTEDQDASDSGAAPGYSFEGFNVDFSEKVMLTPVAPRQAAAAQSQSAVRPFSLDKGVWHGREELP